MESEAFNPWLFVFKYVVAAGCYAAAIEWSHGWQMPFGTAAAYGVGAVVILAVASVVLLLIAAGLRKVSE